TEIFAADYATRQLTTGRPLFQVLWRLPLMSAPQFFPCGRSRREFVWEMGCGFAGMALSSLLAGDGFFSRHGLSAEQPDRTLQPLAARAPQLPPRAKACIFLMMNGAPSQVDTFDYKPEL